MITMLEKQQIIISYFRQGLSQRQIAKDLQISRKTVKRYIDQYLEEVSPINPEVGVINPPKYDSSGRTKKKLIKPITDYIDACIKKNDEKKSTGMSKQCMAATDIHQALIDSGYDIGYTTVSVYIRHQQQKKQEIYIRQDYEPGSCAEFDWGEVKLVIGGKIKRLMLAVFTLAYSNHRWAKLFYRQDMCSFLAAHVHYFNHIQGVPLQLVYDNMKTAVAKCTIKQHDKKPTDDLLKISSYYQFDFRFCNIASGNEKGHVEKSVEFVRRKAFCQFDNFDSLDQANLHLINKVDELNQDNVQRKSISIFQDFLSEQEQFLSLPVSAYDFSILEEYKMNKYYTISVDTNQYSVPETIFGPIVKVKVLPSHILIFDRKHTCVAQHQRLHDKYQWVINIEHYWNSLSTKPGALKQSMAMKQAPEVLKNLFEEHYKNIPKVFVQIILYCKEHAFSIDQLHRATILCIRKCLNTPITFDKLTLLLHNQDTSCSNTQASTYAPGPMAQSISDNCLDLLAQVQAQFS